MAITFINKGTWAAGTTSIAPGIPASMQAGDFMILTVHTCNQAVTTPSGWTLVTNSPVSTGTANAAGGTRVNAYYRWWQSGDAAPTVAVTGGTVTNGIISGYRGVNPTTPFDATPVATTLATANATLTMTGITTATANALIHWAIARDQDLNTTTAVTAFTNANLTGITEVHDQVVNTGVGGGIWTGYGFKATAGATGNLTITQTSSIAVGLTIALRPKPNAYLLTAQGGTYTATGGSATLSRNRNLSAQGGAYSLSGGQATITVAATANNYTLTALGGSYSLSGGSAVIKRDRKLTASGGTYALSGQQVTISRNRRLTASGGTYAYSGQQVTITYTPTATGYVLTALGGSYVLSGQQATIKRNRRLTASGGSYVLNGQQVTLKRNRKLTASGGSYAVTGATIGLYRNRKLTASGGTYSLSGNSATITWTAVNPYPDPAYVLKGVIYGNLAQYVGTYDPSLLKLDLTTGKLIKPITSTTVISL